MVSLCARNKISASPFPSISEIFKSYIAISVVVGIAPSKKRELKEYIDMKEECLKDKMHIRSNYNAEELLWESFNAESFKSYIAISVVVGIAPSISSVQNNSSLLLSV